MPSHVYQHGPVTPEMNITPLIDVTFLLIIFFMLVSNIISEELEQMIVPEPDVPRSQAMGEAEGRVVVNIVPAPGWTFESRAADPLLYPGQAHAVKVGMQEFPLDDLAGVTEALRQARARHPEVEVVLRADAALHYEEVRPVMVALAQAGIQTVNLAAVLPEHTSD